MDKLIDFIRSCGTFFLLTVDADSPVGRPFGAIMEHEGDLFIATSDTKHVYSQLKKCPHVQIIALKSGTRDWVRVSGEAEECYDNVIKQKMLTECSVLTKHFRSYDAPHYSVFRIRVRNTEYYDN